MWAAYLRHGPHNWLEWRRFGPLPLGKQVSESVAVTAGAHMLSVGLYSSFDWDWLPMQEGVHSL